MLRTSTHVFKYLGLYIKIYNFIIHGLGKIPKSNGNKMIYMSIRAFQPQF